MSFQVPFSAAGGAGIAAAEGVEVEGVQIECTDAVSQTTLMLSCFCCQQAFSSEHDTSAADAAEDACIVSGAPYILSPCGHVVCGDCAMAVPSNDNRCVFGHCNVKVTVTKKPDSGLSDLAKAIADAAALAFVAQSTPHCVDCQDDGEETDASVYCFDCTEALCEKHARPHVRKGHKMDSVATGGVAASGPGGSPLRGTAGLSPAERQMRCTIHPSNIMGYHCSKCNTSVCGECAAMPLCLGKQAHSASPAVHPVARVRDLVAVNRESFVAASERIGRHVATVSAHLAALTEGTDMALGSVDSCEVALTQLASNHCASLRNEINATFRSREKQLRAQRDGLMVNQAQCDAVAQVLTAALEADDPVKFGAALTCSKDAGGLTIDKFEGTCASSFIDVSYAGQAIVTDAFANLVLVRKVSPVLSWTLLVQWHV